jgi:hypothetical protein
MRGDFTRRTYRPKRHYSSVRMQQGRVQLDANWNEQAEITTHLRRQAIRNLIGPSGGPSGSSGFNIISRSRGSRLGITRGRYYVDGIQVDNDLDGLDFVDLAEQPYLPGLDPVAGLKPGAYLFYLKAWERHVTAMEDARLREIALDGPDTATRTQVVWQVKPFRLGDPANQLDCSKFGSDWQPPNTVTTGKLQARVQPAAPPQVDDCLLPPQGGYRGLENHLYRVEIHTGGDHTQATFKWSRENGSVVTTWIDTNGDQVIVNSAGRDDHLNFKTNSWVELSSDENELINPPGSLARVQAVTDDSLTVDMGTVTGSLDPTDYSGVKIARRWEGFAPVKDYLDSNELEDGLEIKFASGHYCTGDYWLIPARARLNGDTGTIEWPPDPTTALEQPPAGMSHAYCVLALANYDGRVWSRLTDCRKLFPPLTEVVPGVDRTQASSNCCTVTVGDGALSHGVFDDLQAAVDYARSLKRAARVCLLPGRHVLKKPVAVIGSSEAPLTLAGCGMSAQLHFLPQEAEPVTKVTHVDPGKSVTVDVKHAPFTGNFDVLVSEETTAGTGAWVRAGRVDARTSRDMKVAVALPESMRSAARLRFRLQDPERPGISLDTTIDNARLPDTVSWPETLPAPSDAPSMLISGPFVELVNLDIEGHLPGTPAVLLFGESVTVENCTLASVSSAPLLLVAGKDARLINNQIIGRESAALHGNGLLFHNNLLRGGGIQIVSGSANAEIRDNQITIATTGDHPTPSLIGVLLGKLRQFNLQAIVSILSWLTQDQDSRIKQTGTEEDSGESANLAAAQKFIARNVDGIDLIKESFNDICIQGNHIRGGLFGVARNDVSVLTMASKVTIVDNNIAECGRNLPLGGGINLQGIYDLYIADNLITNNGTQTGAFGILLQHCAGVIIHNNRILHNGGPQKDSVPSLQAGILAIDLHERGGIPAVALHENIIVTPAGPALSLTAFGDVVVTDNQLTSLDALPQPAFDKLSGGAVNAITHSLEGLGLCATVIQLGPGEEKTEVIHRVMFSKNQVTLSGTSVPLNPNSPMAALFSLGDLSIQDNQFALEGNAPDKTPQLASVRVEGTLVRVLGNSFIEPGGRVKFSCISSAIINTTANNMGVHCISVLPSPSPQTVDRDNQILVPCEGTATGADRSMGAIRAIAPSTYRKAMPRMRTPAKAKSEAVAPEVKDVPEIEMRPLWDLYRPILRNLAENETQRAVLLKEAAVRLDEVKESEETKLLTTKGGRAGQILSPEAKELDRQAKASEALAKRLRVRAEQSEEADEQNTAKKTPNKGK